MQIDGVDYSFRPSHYRNGRLLPNDPEIRKNLWHSDGVVSSNKEGLVQDINYAKNVSGYSKFTINVTPRQKRKLLNAINKSSLSPPHYRTVGKRCAGWAMQMLRRGRIVGSFSKLFEWSPWPTRKYLKMKSDNRIKLIEDIKH